MSEGDPDAADDTERADTDIRELDERTVQQIAAGEVVERPASVVKELVENSLDADASRVDVTVEAGGTERIVVRDDGVGMTEADARAAVREHTTSKIRDVDDLESGVGTLGFRGEALYTIGAVSRMTVRTKPRDGDRGTELRLVGGDLEAVGPTGCPEGTTVEVDDLFFNTPARQKYLKTESTEFSRVNRVVTRYALANPDVAVSLSHDGREVFSTTGRGDRQSTVLSVYGREVAEAMIPVDADTDPDDGPVDVSVSGHVSHPETTRSSREYVSTYVNGRYVRSAAIREATLEAYGNQLAPDRYPFAVLFVDLPGDGVDVNAHPRKMEVRFGEEGAVRDAVRDAVEAALLDHGLVRSSAPRGRSAPDETEVAPEREAVDDRPVHEQAELGADGDAATDSASDAPAATDSPDPAANPATADGDADEAEAPSATETPESFADDSTTTARSTPPTASDDEPPEGPAATESTTTRSAGSSATGATPHESSGGATSEPSRADVESAARSGESTTDGDSGTSADSAGTSADSARTAGDSSRKFQSATETATLGRAGDEAATEFDNLPSMRVLGQLHDTYVVAETPDGLVLVDQHAADERVNYERLCEQFAGETTTQVLADPVELELTAREAALFDEYRDALAQLGFHAGRVPGRDAASDGADSHDALDDRLVEVTTVPAVLGETLDPGLLRDVLSEFVSTDPDERGESTVSATADALLSDLACYPSVTGNTSLREGDVVELLAALDDCENPYSCPHGRPVVIEIGEREIEERFERDYPGHAGRRPE